MKLFDHLQEPVVGSIIEFVVSHELEHSLWIQLAEFKKDPDDESQAIAAVKIEFYEGKLQLLSWLKSSLGGDPDFRIVLADYN